MLQCLLTKLWSLKIAAQESIETYRNEIDRLEQKKQYLISFINLYKQKADEKFESILTSKEDVNKMVLTFIDDIVKKNYRTNDNIPENIKILIKTWADVAFNKSNPLESVEMLAFFENAKTFYTKIIAAIIAQKIQFVNSTIIYLSFLFLF